MRVTFSAAIAALVFAVPVAAFADEVWSSDQFGEVVYAKDIGNIAVLSLQGQHPGSKIFIYLPGLGGNISERGVFTGYWIETAPGECETEMSSDDGIRSDSWGKAQVEFENPGYPSGFVLRVGSCDGDYSDEGWAEPS